MFKVVFTSRPGSSLRLPTLLAIAHAALAFYLWFCAFDVNLALTSVRLWQILAALWFVWPILLAARAAVRFTRFVRDASRPKPAPQGDARKPIVFVAPPRAPAPGFPRASIMRNNFDGRPYLIVDRQPVVAYAWQSRRSPYE